MVVRCYALGGAARTPPYLEAVHQRGYRFIGPLARQDSALGLTLNS
jgi:hypothetical protein